MTTDYLIIGGGTAGCVLANRLSAHSGHQVTVLEAGGPDRKMEIHIPAGYAKLHRSAVDWAFYSEPQEHLYQRQLFLPRGKTLGGSSSTNAMAYIRGNQGDYDHWAALGNPGWDYASILPYFIKAEHNAQYGELDPQYHGQGGPLHVGYAQRFRTPVARAFVESCAALGIPFTPDFNGPQQEGAGFFQFTIKNQRRHSAAVAYLHPVRQRKNLQVITHAQVLQIILEQDQAKGVFFRDGRGQTQELRVRREVILAAGSFQSPQLLLLSGIGAADYLKSFGIPVKYDLPGVGQNLQDHLFCNVSAHSTIPTLNHTLQPLPQLLATLQYGLMGRGPLTIGPLEANAFTRVKPDAAYPDLQLHFAPLYGDYDTDLYDVNSIPATSGYSILPTLLKPASRGYVGLHSTNPLEAPLIQPNFFKEEQDLQQLIAGTRLALELVAQAPLQRYTKALMLPSAGASDDELAHHLRRRVETVYHPSGTCKMGNDEAAVVDANLRVRGVAGLRVMDCSIMPEVISGNTNAAVIMIAEKGADLVLAEG